MKNKTMIVPKDIEAENNLDYDLAKDSQLIMWHLNNNEYEELDKAHIFELLNDYCNALIDEYEDEKIDYLKLETFKDNVFVNFENIYIKKLYDLMEEAINRKTSIHFYF